MADLRSLMNTVFWSSCNKYSGYSSKNVFGSTAKFGIKFFSDIYVPLNHIAYETPFTPGIWRIFSLYERGREKTREIEFLLISRVEEDASTPEYHALTSVLSIPNARMAMVIPRMVSAVRSLWRSAFLKMSLRMCI